MTRSGSRWTGGPTIGSGLARPCEPILLYFPLRVCSRRHIPIPHHLPSHLSVIAPHDTSRLLRLARLLPAREGVDGRGKVLR
eukprot:4405414-Pyramimonas_sp.AAC.1